MTEEDVIAVASWERTDDGVYHSQRTGPRALPARCYECGEDTDEAPSLDGHTFCSRACLDAWVRR